MRVLLGLGKLWGLYKKFNVIPDMLIYGKTLGNGYAINAILGKGGYGHRKNFY